MTDRLNHVPSPAIFPGDEPFWEAAREGRFITKHCPACQRFHFYPRAHCPLCGHDKTEWRELSGKGTIYSYTTDRNGPRAGAPVIIELEEGVRLQSLVLGADTHALKIGDRVRARFVMNAEAHPILTFTTPEADDARAYTSDAYAKLQAGLDPQASCPQNIAVVGAGNMGVGIALAFLQVNLPVLLLDRDEKALAGGLERIAQELDRSVARGRIDAASKQLYLSRLSSSTVLASAAQSDLVIEAIIEDLAIKRELFAQLDAIVGPNTVLATNTSTLDVGAIAQATQRPEAVVGLHFFNPAHVMRLIEIIKSPLTSERTLQTAQAIAQRLKKTGVVVGICDGFVGNRLMIVRESQAMQLLLEGAQPQDIDQFLREFGLPMGTFELQDMAGGIPLMQRSRQRKGEPVWLLDKMVEMGRLGLRAGRGFYRYEPGKKRPLPDREMQELLNQASAQAGLTRRAVSRQEIHDRLILPMLNEAAKLIEEKIVDRPSDIDLVWQLGYGWPDWKGGPVYYADQLGAAEIHARLLGLQAAHGELFRPAELLTTLAHSGAQLSQSQS